MDKIRINLYQLLLCISNALDLISPRLSNHHQQVAYLAYRLAEQSKMTVEQQRDIFLAALLHDIGAVSLEERLEVIEAEPYNASNHAFRGAKLLDGFKPLQSAANIIKFHHLPWNCGRGMVCEGEDVPFESHIIHIADRVCAKIRSARNVLTQVPDILDEIRGQNNIIFEPGLVDALFELGSKEYIWLDLIAPSPIEMLPSIDLLDIVVLEMDDICDLAYVFSHIIDFRSKFTAWHSAGVANTAQKLAQLVGFSHNECKMMLIAGYLHDLGKLAIDNAILEKPGKLNQDEFNQMRSHTYYTYRLLETIPQFKIINQWASYHHEKPNGSGYPFHIKGDSITLGSRIMAVADVFTAIMEDRPYRQGMSSDQAVRVLNNMALNGSLDEKVVSLLIHQFTSINNHRIQAQQQAAQRYKNFLESKAISSLHLLSAH